MLRGMVPGGEAKLMAQLRRGSIQYCVLALLRERDRYGFELTRQLAGADGLVTSEGTVYPLLARLRHEGLVETTWQTISSLLQILPSGLLKKLLACPCAYLIFREGDTANGPIFREDCSGGAG